MTEFALPMVYLSAAILFLGEHLFPAHKTKPQLTWYIRSVSINSVNLLVFFLMAMLMESAQLPSLFHIGEGLPPLAGAFVAYVIFTFVVYWWHRLRHHSAFFWRTFHQLHHSPKRIETLTAYYIHPLDMLANLIISNTIVFALLGLGMEAAAWYTVITGIAGFLIHANIRLPRQVGYVFQTPEMHRLHHQSSHHANNYSDIVWWDMLFGTYANPRESIDHCGFDEASESKVLAMLMTKDIRPEY
ncbi:MAG: sterol desaturase family protein [Gammaproteobacteria bacterium]